MTDETFAEKVLNSGKSVLVDLWAEWFGLCSLIAPVSEALAAEHSEPFSVTSRDGL
ncbi:thioredoxin family protein [Streptomyces chiangmaiensis]|uniref:thioredoxin family protein n=1 Tax=Streptomyces chiangmaiensis TaxID=766497 RepID=UPI0031E84B4B